MKYKNINYTQQLSFRCVHITNNESAVAQLAPIISGKPVRFLWGLSRVFVGDGGRKSLNSGRQILLLFLKNYFDIDS
ncbi:hypothetical protein [Aquiflexum lacus]|uniref:hypothetical protein n=1 Tax=Aquiflexum lacus TaxID=2483805 RepID=UPI0018932920|nr:hypothetical protein [Aquiflexum lacus]